MPRLAAVLYLALALAACSRTAPSADLQLSDISFHIWVLARSSTETEIAAFLRPGRRISFVGQYVELTGGDRLFAEVDGRRYPLTGPGLLSNGSTGYQAKVPTGAAGTSVRIFFQRAAGPPTLIASGRLPAPFELAELPRSPSVSQPLEIRWSPAGERPMEIVLKGPCISKQTIWMGDDPGRSIVKPGTLRPPVFQWKDCPIDLIVARVGEGRTGRGTTHPGSGFLIRQVRSARLEPVK